MCLCLLALQHTEKESRSMLRNYVCVCVCVCMSGVVSTLTASRCPYQQLMSSASASPLPITFWLFLLRHFVLPFHPTHPSHLYCRVSFFSPVFPTTQTPKPLPWFRPTFPSSFSMLLCISTLEVGGGWAVMRSILLCRLTLLTQYSDYQPLLLTRLST